MFDEIYCVYTWLVEKNFDAAKFRILIQRGWEIPMYEFF